MDTLPPIITHQTTPQTSKTQKPKRPASHRWTLGITAFMTVGFIVFLIDVISGRSGATFKQYWQYLTVFSFFAVVFFSLLVGGRRKWAYYMTSTFLALYSLRATYTSLLYIYNLLFSQDTFTRPYFHLAQRSQSFAVQQNTPAVQQILAPLATALLIWLSYRFIFGRQSRTYYQFNVEEKPIEGKAA